MDEKCREASQCIANEEAVSPRKGCCQMDADAAAEVELLDACSRAVVAVVETVDPAVVGVMATKTPDASAPDAKRAGIPSASPAILEAIWSIHRAGWSDCTAIVAVAQGIGFAVLANMPMWVVSPLLTHGRVSRGR
jgi:hypothetical protein